MPLLFVPLFFVPLLFVPLSFARLWFTPLVLTAFTFSLAETDRFQDEGTGLFIDRQLRSRILIVF